ncbi:hypothetical protein AX15_002462 [Amanita polypyramis BW_CC]|nr:hypothetical protein AX15_002462 [Amanita polypyramis BW_CC]
MTTTTTKTLPPHIWDYLAQFIPARCLANMINVNRYFFNLAMEYRYRQISFTYLNERMLWMLVRLKDPSVSYRVRTIYIYPDFLKQELYSSRVLKVDRHCLRNNSDILRYKLFLKTGKCCLSAGSLIDWMQDVLSGLPNVTEYHITWTGLPRLSKNPAPLIASVFKTAPIQRLTLTISLENITFLDTRAFNKLHNLEELQILLHNDSASFLADPYTLNKLATVINGVRNTLKTLDIEAWAPIQLSQLLSLIERLPHLEKLLIALPVDDAQLGDPSGLSTFLNLHCSNLRVLALRAEQHVGRASHLTRSEPFFLDHWFQEALRGVTLTQIQSLEINSSYVPTETCLACVWAFRSSLTSLSLTGQYQTLSLVDQVATAFAGRGVENGLKSLRLGSITLSPRLVDLLAEKVPGLESLCLYVKDVVPSLPLADHYALQSLSRCERREEQLESFLSEMETRRYPKWRLRHVRLVLSMAEADYWQTHVEAVLAECVPSIRIFG